MTYEEYAKTLPMSRNLAVLAESAIIGGKTMPNRIAIQPMEGADGTPYGAPSELTVRRYHKFARSGAGLIWFEAVAVTREGRANPRQLWLTPDNVDAYAYLLNEIREIAQRECGITPLIIMQGTHSGRYSKPDGVAQPVIAYNNPIFEKGHPLPQSCIVTDDELQRIEQSYDRTTQLAQRAGFDGIDVKSCHRYLANELLSAYNREGAYGGSFENRTRFIRNCIDVARGAAKGDFIVTTRVNIYDGFPYPYGFGVRQGGDSDDLTPDLSESLELIKLLDMGMIDITMGNPYVNPQVNRPTELVGVERMYDLTKQVQDAFPDLFVISSAPTYLREHSGYLSAGAVEQGYCKAVGFGRMAFAYPTFARDILADKFDKKQTCVTCGKCSELMRGGRTAGCVVRDPYYAELYKEMKAANKG